MALIPISPFIAIHGLYSMYMETECPKLSSWYLCEKKIGFKIMDKPDCVQQLITQQHLNSCTLTPVTLHKQALEQLDEKHYTLSFPIPAKVQMLCGQEQFRTLQGSYLATIPQDCLIRTTEFTIANIDNRIKGHVLRIRTLWDQNTTSRTEESLVQLNSINLENLHESYKKVSMQPPVRLNKISDGSLYHTTIPVYLLLCSAGVLAVALTYRHWMRNKDKKIDTTSIEIKANQDIYAEAEPRSNIHPAGIKMDPSHLTATFLTTVNK